MSYRVIVDPEADADLLRLYGYLLARAEYVEDLEIAERALGAISTAMASLTATPLLYRKAGNRKPLRRELVVPFGSAGYVVEYEVAGPELVVVLAVRHQREEDYH